MLLKNLVLVIIIGALAMSVAARVTDTSLHDVLQSIQQEKTHISQPVETPQPVPTFSPAPAPTCEAFGEKSCFENLRPRTQ